MNQAKKRVINDAGRKFDLTRVPNKVEVTSQDSGGVREYIEARPLFIDDNGDKYVSLDAPGQYQNQRTFEVVTELKD